MPDVLPVLVSAVVAFVLSGVWYAVFGGRLAALHEAYREPRPRATTAIVFCAVTANPSACSPTSRSPRARS